jgi:hypothetical protein
MQERIEGDYATDPGDGNSERAGDSRQGRRRQEAQRFLDLAQHLQQLRRFASPGSQGIFYCGIGGGCVWGVANHESTWRRRLSRRAQG